MTSDPLTHPYPTTDLPTPEIADPAIIEAEQLALLTQYAMNLARLLHDTADRLAADIPAQAAERIVPLSRAFDRMSRTVRQTIALARRLRTTPNTITPITTTPTAAIASSRRLILRRVENTIDDKIKDPRETENLLRDLHERLEDPALDEDIASRPLVDIIQDIRQDLGIGLSHLPHNKRRTAAQARRLSEVAQARSGALPPNPHWGQGTPGPIHFGSSGNSNLPLPSS